MKKLQFKRIGILIALTLVVSIGVQIYRNVTQFRLNETQLTTEIQLSLDNALEVYFADLAKTDVITLTENKSTTIKLRNTENAEFDSTGNDFFKKIGESKILIKALEKIEAGDTSAVSWFGEFDTTKNLTFKTHFDTLNSIDPTKIQNINIFRGLDAADSIRNLKMLTNQIIISITRDSLDFEKISALVKDELDRRDININYGLLQYEKDTIAGSFNYPALTEMPFSTVSKSTFLPRGQKLEMYFENTALTVLKRGMVDIMMSIIFLLIISAAFYYLYQTIKNQKEIAEIKEDLIGNITHEFKTPIATTLSAIEGIEQFNPENNPEKTKKYLGISKSQMLKLNLMVEKLLETATLDSDQFILQKEQIDPLAVLRSLVQKFQTLEPEKEIELVLPSHVTPILVDPFHFENVLSNLLDNALKYGGDEVRITLDQGASTRIRIWDNGGNISSDQRDKVFEQFYRIPKGNLHDVKGFGIGLYYVKKIIEKHEGKIELESSERCTSFITIWP
ncbi:sensor histidine kinase [Algoriphagus winogradskyi]|uniref:histidine kinase n=1 Tax=Algoriphagus winogradskyi TaxID=237017 RepID=A0ABY1PN00_9BACT|nr:HAMP domain-containing sensor histidine kinase [Algoriphagus winogradskyi]SMP36096.1 two-component system, OmpR family, phosphate regulon sensor histidine kinase PhoR [Algoriphagus winogradskyi]